MGEIIEQRRKGSYTLKKYDGKKGGRKRRDNRRRIGSNRCNIYGEGKKRRDGS